MHCAVEGKKKTRAGCPSSDQRSRFVTLTCSIVPSRAQASRRCETQATLGGKEAAKLRVAFRSLDPFRALRGPEIRRRDEKQAFPAPNNKHGKGKQHSSRISLVGDTQYQNAHHHFAIIRNSMAYTLKQAAEATGKTKPTILRAIQKSKVSAKKDEHGEWLIDPAELHRVYDPVSEGTDARTDADAPATLREIELLREMLADKDKQIEGLTRRVEAVDEERRTTLRQLTALLTDQRAKPIITLPPATAAQPPDPAKRRWRLFGGRG